MDRGAWQAAVHGAAELNATEHKEVPYQEARDKCPSFQQVHVGFDLTGMFAQVHKDVCTRMNTGRKKERYIHLPRKDWIHELWSILTTEPFEP